MKVATRRGFLGAAAAIPVAAHVVAPQTSPPAAGHPDAELIAVCAAFDELERGYIATGGDHGTELPEQAAADAEQARIPEVRVPLVARMVKVGAVTREGMAARARSLALWDADPMKDGTVGTGECLTYAIVRDLVTSGQEERA